MSDTGMDPSVGYVSIFNFMSKVKCLKCHTNEQKHQGLNTGS